MIDNICLSVVVMPSASALPPSLSRQPPSSSAATIIVATEPSSPPPPPLISCFVSEVPFRIQRNPFGIKQKQKKSILFTAQLLRKTNLAEIFSDARFGTIAHKNKELRQSPIVMYFRTIIDPAWKFGRNLEIERKSFRHFLLCEMIVKTTCTS